MRGHKKFLALSHIVLIMCCVIALIPFWLLLAASFTDESYVAHNGYSLLPASLSLDAYKYLLSKIAWFGRGYGITLVVTVVGVVLCVLITTMLGYMLSKRQMPFVKLLGFYIVFTMLFNGGLVATYINYSNVFHIKNTLWAYIIPGILCNAFYVMLTKGYFLNSIPEELVEAARIDGASEYKIFFKIAFPLAKPIIATIALMVGVMYWNDWQNGMYYIDDQSLYGIQNILNAINSNAKYLATMGGNVASIPTETTRMAVAVVGILPIVAAYPFFQEYFAKGITIGAVKG